ncbi:hypothetical protein [Piscinibacter sp.]|uniref:hypothetical protein n=1 Tax=Piscinibacter sp. TaxID=1903157 RepID=UPI002B5DBED3|nr:hypothetical protein [Albitalea sp.]HUG21190.1 hypothetical protein [Albitalea sp.]
MFDRFFSAALVFCVLAGGTLAIGTAMLEQPAAEVLAVQLPRVEVTGKRPVPADKVAHADHAADAQVQ